MTMRQKQLLMSVLVFIAVIPIIICSCGSPANTNDDPHFDELGYLVRDSNNIPFAPECPSKIKFYVEVSGSMNGFFRANAPTRFKADVWQILCYYAPVSEGVTILTNDGTQGAKFSISQFQTQMNTGAFVSSASTKVPLMLQSIIQSLDTDADEVAVLISDMKYSPVGAAAPQVLLTQYSTDISTILGKFGKAVCLIGATSEFLDRNGNSVCNTSPYYYMVIGKPEHVAELRNGISTFLVNNGNFIDNIESGFSYGAPSYSFGIPNNAYQFENEPTFLGYDPSFSDTCTIKLKVDLANYRWAITKKELFEQAFQCKTLYGSEVKIGNIEFDIQNITDKVLKRTAIATVDLKLCHMATDSEVIEWTLQLPDLDITDFTPYLGGTDENDVTKSFSLENFIKGMFYGGVINKSLKSNYILISKEL